MNRSKSRAEVPGGARRWCERGAAFAVGVLLVLGSLTAVTGCDLGAPAGETAGTPTAAAGAPVGTQASPDLQRGQQVFTQNCARCHPGGREGSGPSLVNRDEPDSRIEITVRRGRGRMPAFGPNTVSDGDLQALIAYLHTLK